MRMLTTAFAAALVAFVLTPAEAQQPQQRAQAQAPAPVREITKIAGEVYRFRNNFHYSVFTVTPRGVIATDPINADAARWLKQEIQTRFNQPVRYVIYSHDHADHSSGGEVFADTAIFVSHANAKPTFIGEKRPTQVPDITFDGQMTIELGGTVAELTYVGRNHSDNSLVLRFPRERILFAVDFIPVKAMAFRDFPDSYMPDWIESLARVELMDFDVLAPGHGPLGVKADVTAFREYLTDLRSEVMKAAREGKTVDQAKETIALPKYQSWMGYNDALKLNIEGMYRLVQGTRRPN